jgi:imidazolonepropionase-like amidohydrolase
VKPASDESAAELGKTWTRVWVGAHIATMAEGAPPYGILQDSAIAVRGERIAWIGPAGAAARAAAKHGIPSHDLRGAWITPGLIDSHTHLVYGGNRVAEFERRLSGDSYEEIAKAGGGIQSTVRATRAASAEALRASARIRAQSLMAEGVTTIEVKSGYGLELAAERRLLEVARSLQRRSRLRRLTSGCMRCPRSFVPTGALLSIWPAGHGWRRWRPTASSTRSTHFVNRSRSAVRRPSNFCAPHRPCVCRCTCTRDN